MTKQSHHFDLTDANTRIASHAALAGVAAPVMLLSDDGAPSPEVLRYCDSHQITLDWVFLGVEPMSRENRAALSKRTAPDAARVAGRIYESDTGGLDVTGKVGRLHSLARIGIAASDSCMNIDLQKSGYQGLFEQMCLIADELFGDVEELELRAQKGGAPQSDLPPAV